MLLKKIPAFLDGNSFVHFNESLNRILVGNSEGLIKVFNPDEPQSEPASIDIPENLTSLTSHGQSVILTNTEGHLAKIKISSTISGTEVCDTIYRSELPLRDAVFINDGNRVLCGGDDDKLVVVDLDNGNKSSVVSMPDQIVNITYNPNGEIASVGLANGDVHMYAVINEAPTLIEKITGVIPSKVNTSIDAVDFCGEHAHELVHTKPVWSQNGENLFLPTAGSSINVYDRSDWSVKKELKPQAENLIALAFSPSGKFIALLHKDGQIHVFDIASAKLVKKTTLDRLDAQTLPINLIWYRDTIYAGSTNGELHTIQIDLDDAIEKPAISADVESLFLDEASDSDSEEAAQTNGRRKSTRDRLDDSMIIDEEDEDPADFYNKDVDDYLHSRKKRHKSMLVRPLEAQGVAVEHIVPYSPGSTPWIKSVNSSTSTTMRRYIFMNNIGYLWSVKHTSNGVSDEQKSITISFFDRTINKDYHFIDSYDYDLCSMNERGVILACSGYENKKAQHKGKIFYRHHSNTNDSWDRKIPLLPDEYITCICITSTASMSSGDSIIVVGTSLGYVRFFNLYGLCVNLMKLSPVVSLISSEISTVFIVNQVAALNFSYLILSINDDYAFLQQDRVMPLRQPTGQVPLLKGLFFNEHSDPCVVAGFDDSLTILSQWREPGNARWVPILNCKDVVTDYGLSESKKNWKTWPLGLLDDKFVCLVLKNTYEHPGFPLPLPIELDIKLPVKCFEHLKTSGGNGDDDDDEESASSKINKTQEEDPEEQFLRSSTMGKLLSSSLADGGNEEEYEERLNNYSVVFDKSLLKLFANACQDSRLNKAFSVVKLIKNDKALLAASKIAERFEYLNLSSKISKLRENLIEFENSQDK